MTETSAGEPGLRRMPSGVRGLDTILGGGFMVGGIYIVDGVPGVGKTILANQVCFSQAANGGRALFVTLLAENLGRMTASLRGMSFFDESRIPDVVTYISAFRELREGGVKGLGDLLRREIQRRRCTMLVLDGLASAQASADSDQAFREFVQGLQEIALAFDCTIFLTSVLGGKVITPDQAMVDGLIELSDRPYGWRSESDLQITKFRGSAFLRGLHSYKITNDGVVVFPRMESALAKPSAREARTGPIERSSSGIEVFDTMLGGGFPRASTTMIMGPSGSGKTTLGLQFLSRSSEAERGLIFGFYETPERLQARSHRSDPSLHTLLESGVVEIAWQSPEGDLLDAYGERLLEAVRRGNVKRLFIDGLTGFKKYAVEPTRLGQFFSALANELRALDVTTLYSLEVPELLGPAARVPIDDVSSLAENLILLRYVEQNSELHRIISIMKMRDSDFDRSLQGFVLTSGGIKIQGSAGSAKSVLSDSRETDDGGSQPSVTSTAAASQPEDES